MKRCRPLQVGELNQRHGGTARGGHPIWEGSASSVAAQQEGDGKRKAGRAAQRQWSMAEQIAQWHRQQPTVPGCWWTPSRPKLQSIRAEGERSWYRVHRLQPDGSRRRDRCKHCRHWARPTLNHNSRLRLQACLSAGGPRGPGAAGAARKTTCARTMTFCFFPGNGKR